jgi:hypothetical protein
MVDDAANSSGAEQKAQNIENIYLIQGAPQALAALRDDFAKTMSAPGTAPADGAAQNWMEFSRLGATDQRNDVMTGLAVEWAGQQMSQRNVNELRYTELLPQNDVKADPNLPDVQLDKIMVRDLKNNWVDNANLTGMGQDGVPMDAGTVTLGSAQLSIDQEGAETNRQTLIAEETPLQLPKLSLWASIESDIVLS